MPHIHDLIDFTVDIFIVYQNKVLLIFHKKHNMWLQVGGHIELNEDPEEALFREVKEECGLEIEIIGPDASEAGSAGSPVSEKQPKFELKGTKFLYAPVFMNIHEINETHKHIALIYFAKAKSDKFVLSQREHNDIKWFSKEDLDKSEFNLNEAVKFYAKEALNKII